MKILVSPSKNMKKSDFKGEISAIENVELLEMLKSLSWEEIRDKMSVSEKIAKLNYDRYQNFNPISQAIHTYDGLQFKQLELEKYQETHYRYLSEKVKIVSALYGLVNPLHNIGYYRLEMNSTLQIYNQTISEYWATIFKKMFQSEIVISLLSKEYEQVFDSSLNIIKIHFEVEKDEVFKTTKSIKICRGKFLNSCIMNLIATPDDLKKIEFDGYKYHDKSTKNDFYYVKQG